MQACFCGDTTVAYYITPAEQNLNRFWNEWFLEAGNTANKWKKQAGFYRVCSWIEMKTYRNINEVTQKEPQVRSKVFPGHLKEKRWETEKKLNGTFAITELQNFTLVLLNPDIPWLCKKCGSALFVVKYEN